MKVLPFDGKDLVNGSVQQSLQDIYEEVKITSVLGKSLNTLVGFETNFVKLIDSFICHGPYPDYLLQEIDKWAEKNNSENDRPDYFTKNQLFMVLILENGGEDLEHCHKFKSWKQVKGLLAQTIFSTAVAERLIKFEHRDLHWGNLLCSPCAAGSVHRYELQKKNIMCGSEMAVMEIETDGIRACIIDFTLSRLEFDSHVFAVHLDDEDLYTGEGDYQVRGKVRRNV